MAQSWGVSGVPRRREQPEVITGAVPAAAEGVAPAAAAPAKKGAEKKVPAKK